MKITIKTTMRYSTKSSENLQLKTWILANAGEDVEK